MKTIANRIVLFAATALAAGTMAFGQTTMKAEIPFAFRTSNASLPAGTYTFYATSSAAGTEIIRVSSATSHVMVVTQPLDVYRTAQAAPSVVFACSSEGCSLREIKTAAGSLVCYSSGKKHAPGEAAVSLISIPLSTRNGD